MNIKKILSFFILLVLLSGCMAPQPKSPSKYQYYGEKPSNDYVLSKIKTDMQNKLKDPYSAIYTCSSPFKAWATASTWQNVKMGGRVHYGYVVVCDINSKNSFGGYTGNKRYKFMFKDKLMYQLTGVIKIQKV